MKKSIIVRILVFFLIVSFVLNVLDYKAIAKGSVSSGVTLKSGVNGLFYPQFNGNDDEYVDAMIEWMDKYGYTPYFCDYLKTGSMTDFLDQTLQIPIVDSNNEAYLVDSDITVKKLMAYIIFSEQCQAYSSEMELAIQNVNYNTYSMNYKKAYDSIMDFYKTYLSFESEIEGVEELNRDIANLMLSQYIIGMIDETKLSKCYGYIKKIYDLKNSEKYLDIVKNDTSANYLNFFLSGGDIDDYTLDIKNKLKDSEKVRDKFYSGVDLVFALKEKSATKLLRVGGDSIFKFLEMEEESLFSDKRDTLKNYLAVSWDLCKNTYDILENCYLNPSIIGSATLGIKISKKYIDDCKKILIDNRKQNAGWYAMCVYNMNDKHRSSLESIIDGNTFDLIPFLESNLSFDNDNYDSIYNKLMLDYETVFKGMGEDISTNLPDYSERIQIIKASLLLNRIKQYDTSEIINALFQSIIANNDLSAKYNVSLDCEELNFGYSYIDYTTVPKLKCKITNTGSMPITIGEIEEVNNYNVTNDIEGVKLQVGDSVELFLSPNKLLDKGVYYEKVKIHIREMDDIGISPVLGLRFAVVPHAKTGEPFELKKNQMLTIDVDECVLKDETQLDSSRKIDNIDEWLENGLVLSGGTLKLKRNVYIDKLKLVSGTITMSSDINLVCREIDTSSFGTVNIQNGTLSVLNTCSIEKNMSFSLGASMIAYNDMSISATNIWTNTDFCIYGHLSGDIRIKDSKWVLFGDIEANTLYIDSSTVNVCNDLTYKGEFTLKGTTSKLIVNGDLYAKGKTYLEGWDPCTVTEGTIELNGDIYSDDYTYKFVMGWDCKQYPLYVNDSVKVIINGKKQQKISGKDIYLGNTFFENQNVVTDTGYNSNFPFKKLL